MFTFKWLLLPLAVASPASARLPTSQANSTSYANHTLAPPVKNDRSAPSPPPSHRTSSSFNVSSPGLHTRESLGDSLEGVHNGSECYCCNKVELEAGESTKPNADSASGCTMTCPDGEANGWGGGYRRDTFGEGDMLAVLGLGPMSGVTANSASTLTTPAAWTTGPCMIDQASPRLLSHQISSMTPNSPASCQSQCAASGYQIAGVQYNRGCWCGNILSVGDEQTPAGLVVSDSECTMAYPGGGGNAFGNPWRMKVYGVGSILSQYKLDGLTPTARVETSSVTRNKIISRSEALASSSATTTGSDSTTLPAKRVIAHHMVGNTYPYTLDTWSTDISLALSAGIDGFALNVGSGGVGNWQREQVKNAYGAAAALSASGSTFGLFLSLDMT
jgi:hypothetical protein